MSRSLNEIEGLARKAARGAGLSWGLAEEAGACVRWLSAQGLDGPGSLAALLIQNDGLAQSDVRPRSLQSPWTAPGESLCPLSAGATLSDCADLVSKEALELRGVSHPVLLLPFLSQAAAGLERALDVTWPGFHATLGPDGALNMPKADAICAERADEVHVRLSDAPCAAPGPCRSRGDLPEEAARVLNAFAHRTYAPDTPESRLSGAGAGLTDND